jgi:hypothetical protein
MPAIKNVNPTTNTPWYADPQKLMKGADTGSSDANIVDTPKAPEENIPELQGATGPKPIAQNDPWAAFPDAVQAQTAAIPASDPWTALPDAPRPIPQAFIDRVAHGELAKQSFDEQSSKPYSQRLAEWTKDQYEHGNYGATALGGLSFMVAALPDIPISLAKKAKQSWDEGLLSGGGLRREDFTDIPGKGQPGDEDFQVGFNAALMFGPHAGRPLIPTEGGEFARMKPDPMTGEMRAEPIGQLPAPQDFQAAADVVTKGEQATNLPAKLDRVWQEKGVPPTEIAHDAEADPVIKQDLLSDNNKLPALYGEGELAGAGGGKPPMPPEPPGGRGLGAEPPKPPEPGSLDDAVAKILSHISVDEASRGRGYSWSRFYSDVVDRFFPISKAVEGDSLRAIEDPYKMARLYSGWTGKADHMLNEGTFDFNTYKNNGPSLKDILDPVKDDMDGFRAFAASARAMELEKLGLEHGFDLDAVEQVGQAGIKKYGKTLEKLVNYQKNMATYLRDSGVLSNKAYDAMLEANKLYVPFHRVMGEDIMAGANSIGGQSMTARNPIKALKGSEREVIDPIESIIKNTYLLTAMAEKNAVGTVLIDTLLKQEKASPVWDKYMGRPKGEAETSEFNLPVVKEDATAIAGYLEGQGATAHPELVDALRDMATPARQGEVSIFRDGKRVSYKVDPDIANAMKGLDRSSVGLIERLLAPLSSTLRAGAVLDPEFAVRHTIRDYLYSFIKTNDGVYTPIDSVKGLMGLVTKDADYWQWQKGGGANATLVSLDRRFLQESLTKFNNETGLFARSWNVINNPNMTTLRKISSITGDTWQTAITPLQMLTEFAMNANHLGGFKKSLRELEAQNTSNLGKTLPAVAGDTLPPAAKGSTLMLRDGKTTAEGLDAAAASRVAGADKKNILDAAWVSRNTGIDIARMGAKMKSWNMISAFMNAKIQDTSQIIEAQLKTPIATTTKIAIGITIPSLALWWANKDDSRYKELPEWEKDVFWNILTDKWQPSSPELAATRPADQVRINNGQIEVNNGTIWRIPKPFSTGVLFGSGPERLADYFYGQNPHAFQGFFQSLAQSTLGDLTPNALVPMLEQSDNRSQFTGRTIINHNLENQLPEYQYNNYTTETAKALGQVISAFPGIKEMRTGEQGSVPAGAARALSSPILIENYVRGWTGALGTYALQAADFGLRKAGVLPDPEHATPTMADIPMVRAFVARYPSSNAQSIQDFYRAYDENKKFFDTYMAQAQSGNADALQKIQDAGGQRMFLQLDAIKQAIGEQAKVIQMIDKNPEIKPYEKRQLIDSLYYGMIQVAAQGNTMFRSVEK